ncbi:MAG: class I SAM-dependent methyltransferase, partial [Bacteroidetes bacterium]|nr:class I SAM-dependent methyltransferase [Bacteroidota bacterium]
MKTDSVKKHYSKEAEAFCNSKQATMRDTYQRDKEIEKTIEYLNTLKACFERPKLLEVGCGNGYVVEQISRELDFASIICIDICEEFIEIARERNLKNVTFKVQDVLNMEFDNASFDIVFSERCLIN